MKGVPDGFSRIKAFSSRLEGMEKDSEILGTAITNWLDESIDKLDALSRFGVDMNDPRVREYDEMETRSNRSWIMINLALKKEQVTCESSFNRTAC
jgi:hypothetical protein